MTHGVYPTLGYANTKVPIAMIDFVENLNIVAAWATHVSCMRSQASRAWQGLGSVTAVIPLQPPWHVNSIIMASNQHVRVLPVTDISQSQADNSD